MTIGFGEPFGSGNLVEMADADTTVFESFEELKAAIETEPTIVSTALLIQAVQSRLQREPRDEMSEEQQQQFAYLRTALVKLEARLSEAASATNREDWAARLRRCAPDDPFPPIETLAGAEAEPADELPAAIKAMFSDAAAFERELAPQVGGAVAEPMRGILGATLAMLVQHYGVDPRQLADYVREVLRFTYPEAFK